MDEEPTKLSEWIEDLKDIYPTYIPTNAVPVETPPPEVQTNFGVWVRFGIRGKMR